MVVLLSTGSATAQVSWDRVATPKEGPARVIGRYTAGCLVGAVELPQSGPGYRVARPERRRAFGHPALVAFVRALAQDVADDKLGPMWIGDLAQPRGGPTPSGHASHQTGLDVDVWFARAPGTPPEPLPLVDLRTRTLTRHYGPRALRMIAAAAAAPGVDRIFVNPVLKRALCNEVTGDRAWLRKVRPWFGHHEHFHVRLTCPADSPACEAQAPLPPGDGCDELDSWLQPTTDAQREKEREQYQSRVGTVPQLPDGCRDLLSTVSGR